MITPAYSPTATERVLPRLALDFTTGVLDSRVTVTRALNTATRVNSSGFIEGVNANLPRFDYDPVTLAPKGLLIEETRTNYITYSQNFAGADWVSDACNLSSAAGISPDGTNNAFNCVPNTTVTNHRVRQQSTSAPASAGVTSYFVKANGYNWAKLRFGGVWLNVNLTNGSVGFTNVGSTDYRIIGYQDGWWRITLYNAGAANAINSYLYPLSVNENSIDPTNWAGDGTSGILIYGAQTEIGTFPTSYIPNLTTGSTTRNADVVTMTGTNFSDWFNASEGAFAVQADCIAVGTQIITQADNGTQNNRITVRFTATQGTFVVQDGGVNQAQLAAGTVAAGTAYKSAGAYKANDFAFSFAAGTVLTDNSGTVPTVDRLRIGSSAAAGGDYLNGHVQNIRYWPQRIINAELQAFSK